MVPRLFLRLASLLSLVLAVLPPAGVENPGASRFSKDEREAVLASLEESWESFHGEGERHDPRAGTREDRALLELLRERVRTATSLEEALRVLTDLASLAAPEALPQGQDTPEASISASRAPTWFPPARFW